MRKLSTWITSAGLLLGTELLAAPASAGPASNLAGLQKQASSDVEPVHYRRYSRRGCWWHRGHWHCPRYRRYAYYDYPSYGGYYPYYYGGPTFAFSFGGGRHWGGHRHWGGRHFHRGGRGRW
jgi:hypothetical protein